MASLLQQASIILIILVIGSMSTIAFISYFIMKDITLEILEEQISLRAQSNAKHFALFLELRLQQLDLLASNPKLIDYIKGDSHVFPFSSQEIAILKGSSSIGYDYNFDTLYEFRIIDKDLNIVYSTKNEEIGHPIDINIIKTDFTNFPHVHYELDYYSNVPATYYTIPIHDSNLKVIGYLSVIFGIEMTEIMLADPIEFNTAEFYLVDSNKRLVTPSRFEGNLQFVTIVDTIPVRKCLEENLPYTGYYEDYRNIRVYGASECLSKFNLILLHEIDKSEIDAPINFLLMYSILASIVVSFISFSLAYFFSHRIIKSIKQFVEISNKLSTGQYQVQFPDTKIKELTVLAYAINQMIDAIKQRDVKSEEHKKIILEQLSKIQEIDTQKSNFSAMMAHELKTPLVPITGYTEMLLEDNLLGTLNPTQQDVVEKLYGSVKNLEALIHKMLYVQRLDLGNIKYNIEKIDISKFMQEIYDENSFLMKEKMIKFVNSTNTTTTLYSDPIMIKEVFSNLIQNSVDFVHENIGYIEINAHTIEKGIQFFVKDNGNGIAKEKQGHLFKKFYQIDTSIRRKHGGTGLGLSICKKIVDDLNGKIWLESDLNKGTTFFFEIPNNTPNIVS